MDVKFNLNIFKSKKTARDISRLLYLYFHSTVSHFIYIIHPTTDLDLLQVTCDLLIANHILTEI